MVNAADVLLARNNQTNFLNGLRLIDLSSSEAEVQETLWADLAWLQDLTARQRPPNANEDSATEAPDRLLATYWP